jgi:hypothetical protein
MMAGRVEGEAQMPKGVTIYYCRLLIHGCQWPQTHRAMTLIPYGDEAGLATIWNGPIVTPAPFGTGFPE